ncbi:MAG: bifunctional hydroxymethylpyrimidine kinase/phosphomethylpyrimidine kinase [bacterium]
MKRALTIAGSDSGGGAGIQADLKAFSALGVFGMSAITALTAQNTLGVQGIVEIEPSFVGQQIDSVVADIGVDAVKIGMLASEGIVAVVARKIREHNLPNVVLDPVMVAKSGDPLLRPEARDALKSLLLPLAYVVTPNLHEAEVLAEMKISRREDAREAARKIRELGARNVVVKGGHLPGEAVDLFYDGENFVEYKAPRLDTPNTHGTGCTFSSAIAAELAKGAGVREAVGRAKEYIAAAIKHSPKLGGGRGPINHLFPLYREAERYRVIREIKSALELLMSTHNIAQLIPEVQSNLGMALEGAEGVEDVAAFPGRIVRVGEKITALADPEFGASRHVARIILTAAGYRPEIKAAMNIRYAPEILDACRNSGFKIASFSRSEEPEEVRSLEGSSLAWGVAAALEGCDFTPDIIYDTGGIGKEAMVRVLGKGAWDVADKARRIAEALN